MCVRWSGVSGRNVTIVSVNVNENGNGSGSGNEDVSVNVNVNVMLSVYDGNEENGLNVLMSVIYLWCVHVNDDAYSSSLLLHLHPFYCALILFLLPSPPNLY